MKHLYGIEVVVSYDQPGYKLPEDLPLKPEFRAQFNLWAASFFRPKPSLLADNQVFHDRVNNRLHMNERTWNKLRREVRNEAVLSARSYGRHVGW